MAEPEFRNAPEDVSRLQTRNREGQMVPLGSLVDVTPHRRCGSRAALQHVHQLAM